MLKAAERFYVLESIINSASTMGVLKFSTKVWNINNINQTCRSTWKPQSSDLAVKFQAYDAISFLFRATADYSEWNKTTASPLCLCSSNGLR